MRIEEVIGQRIRDVREREGITQQDLGREVGELLGRTWSRQAVSTAEKGGRAFTATDLVAVAQVLGTTVGRLVTPPIDVREIELPGKTIPRGEFVPSTLPPASGEKAFDGMQETLRTLAQAMTSINEYMTPGLESVRLLHDQLETAIEIVAAREAANGERGDS